MSCSWRAGVPCPPVSHTAPLHTWCRCCPGAAVAAACTACMRQGFCARLSLPGPGSGFWPSGAAVRAQLSALHHHGGVASVVCLPGFQAATRFACSVPTDSTVINMYVRAAL
jgi:hypothetical protein